MGIINQLRLLMHNMNTRCLPETGLPAAIVVDAACYNPYIVKSGKNEAPDFAMRSSSSRS